MQGNGDLGVLRERGFETVKLSQGGRHSSSSRRVRKVAVAWSRQQFRIYLSICLPICLSVYLPTRVEKIEGRKKQKAFLSLIIIAQLHAINFFAKTKKTYLYVQVQRKADEKERTGLAPLNLIELE